MKPEKNNVLQKACRQRDGFHGAAPTPWCSFGELMPTRPFSAMELELEAAEMALALVIAADEDRLWNELLLLAPCSLQAHLAKARAMRP